MPFRQITIIGTGLIGGSFGLALKKYGFTGKVVGSDKAKVLDQALKIGAIDAAVEDPVASVQGSDLILLAGPVGAIIDLIERVGPIASPDSLITDVGSTKSEVMDRARSVFGADASKRFLPGHPMAGKEHSGIQNADPDLFQNAVWLFTPYEGKPIPGGKPAEFQELIQTIGARPLSIDSAKHDRICAWVSHLPQMLATALAATLMDELGTDPDLQAIGGRALREMTRIAQSPYVMWRDIALTNTQNIEDTLLRLEQKLAHIRENLRTRELEAEFEQAQTFRAEKIAKPVS